MRVGTKSGYINTKGVVVITPQFDDAGPFRYGRAGVRLGNRFGFIDKDGKYISSPDFSWAGQFSGDLAPVRTADGVMAFVNRSGKLELAGKVEMLMPEVSRRALHPLAPVGNGGSLIRLVSGSSIPSSNGRATSPTGLLRWLSGGEWVTSIERQIRHQPPVRLRR